MTYLGQSFEQLVSALERVSSLQEHELDDEERVDAMIAERQEILDAIQKTDASGLCADVREDLAKRIRAVMDQNAQYVAYMTQIREQIREHMDGLVQSRAAVRGYRVASAEVPTKRFDEG